MPGPVPQSQRPAEPWPDQPAFPASASEKVPAQYSKSATNRAERDLERSTRLLRERVAELSAIADQRAAQLRSMAVTLTQTEQRERRRLAQLLHDHLQQLLVAARLNTTLVRRRVDDEEALRGLAQVDELVNESIEVSRSLTVALAPPVLYDVGLIAALQWLVRHMADNRHLAVSLKTEPVSEPADLETRVILFDSIRELLLNVARHAATPQAFVDLHRGADGRIEAIVYDKGQGFDPDLLPSGADTNGFGMFRIRQRVELFGGTMELQSAPGQGTRVAIAVPGSTTAESSPSDWASDAPDPLRRSQRAEPETGAATAYHPRRIRVLLVDDHEIVREGLASLLLAEPDLDVVAQGCDGQEAVELAHSLHPDVILMDVSMPRLDGIEATRRIKADMPDVHIIGLSMHEKEDMARAMARAGASAYLSKNGCSDSLISTIRDEVAGSIS